jgi:hypothetical protein
VGSELQTRKGRERAVIVNALTKPINVVVPAAILVAGFALSWLLPLAPVAALTYALLVTLTLFDEGEAKKVLAGARGAEFPPVEAISVAGLPPRIAEPLGTAVAEEGKIREAIAQAKLPYTDVSAEVGVLMEEMQKVARKGAVIDSYLADPEVAKAASRLAQLERQNRAGGPAAEAQKLAIDALQAQVKIQSELGDQLDRCCAELEHLAASLGVIRGQIVRMSVAEDASVQDDLAGQVRSLRERVSALAEGLTEATSSLSRSTTA